MATGFASNRIDERRLLGGWAAAPHVRIRLATLRDTAAVSELSALAGTSVSHALLGAVRTGIAGTALRAGLRAGPDALVNHFAGRLASQPADQPFLAYLDVSLVLVAEHDDLGPVGVLIASPPARVVGTYLDRMPPDIVRPRERTLIVIRGGVRVAAIKTVAIVESFRGQHIGASLLKRCKQVYGLCGYDLLYGQIRRSPRLESFYRNQGFNVLSDRTPIDLSAALGCTLRIHPVFDEFLFVRHLTNPSKISQSQV